MSKNTVAKAAFVAAAIAVAAIIAISSLSLNKNGTQQQGSGTLSVLLTDPPHLPANVTNVYMSFSSMKIHNTEAEDNSSGWFTVASSGTVDLTKVINLSKVIAVASVPSGEYNLLRFNITSVVVTYSGKNYTASTPSKSLTVTIHPKLEVEDNKLAATIIDISPTVLNTGTRSSPSFVLLPAAHASPVPKNDLSEDMEHEGRDVDLRGHAWWKQLEDEFNTTISITSESLSSNSLSVTVKDTANSSTTLRLVVVTPVEASMPSSSHHQHEGDEKEVPLFFHAAVFLVEKNGSLMPVYKLLNIAEATNSDEPFDEAMHMLSTFGYNLSSGQSVTLSYTGPVILFPPSSVTSSSGISPFIVAGKEYRITVIGTDSIASTLVNASSAQGNTNGVSFYVVSSGIHDDRIFLLVLNTGTETLTSYKIAFQSGQNISSSIRTLQPGEATLITETLPFHVPDNTKSITISLTMYTTNATSATETFQVQVLG